MVLILHTTVHQHLDHIQPTGPQLPKEQSTLGFILLQEELTLDVVKQYLGNIGLDFL
jgi:hypothetical protein